jgi:hypothetical protein
MPEAPQHHTMTPEELARRRKRSIALALVLGALVVIFFVTTVVRMGSHMAQPAGG